MKTMLFAVSLGAFAWSATATAGVATVAPGEVSAREAAGDKMVCKARKKTGTRVGTKTCRTARHWEEMAEANRAALKETVDRPQIKICGPSGCD